jgi:SNF family Na+-dependent transporter
LCADGKSVIEASCSGLEDPTVEKLWTVVGIIVFGGGFLTLTYFALTGGWAAS